MNTNSRSLQQSDNRQLQKRMEYKKQMKAKQVRNRLIVLQLIIFVIVASVIFSLIFVPGNSTLINMTSNRPVALNEVSIANALNRIDYSFLIKQLDSEINSTNAILIDLSSGEVLAQKDPDTKIYPASITKVMTSIIILEHFSDVEAELTVPSEIFTYIYQQNASVAGFWPDERVRIIDLLYGILLPSGADACLTLVTAVAGNEQEFAKMMTEKAREIGAVNTNFANSTGLHDPNHYSTVRDLSLILSYALKNETFRTIFTTENYTTARTSFRSAGLKFTNTTFAAFDRAGIKNEYVKGGKTGYTGEAGLCLATLSQKHGREYVLVTVGAETLFGSRGTNHVRDANYVYKNFT